jgi:hypothetical protein
MITTVLALVLAAAMDPATCPMHAEHMKAKAKANADGSAAHGAAVDKRHDTLGVAHDASKHTFKSLKDGGAIELRATDASDAKTIEAIRNHMQTIAEQFAAKDFSTPHFVHGKTPDGIEDIERLHADITFKYESLPEGARVRMTTANAEALRAIHAFMRFQNIEHRTGDATAR